MSVSPPATVEPPPPLPVRDKKDSLTLTPSTYSCEAIHMPLSGPAVQAADLSYISDGMHVDALVASIEDPTVDVYAQAYASADTQRCSITPDISNYEYRLLCDNGSDPFNYISGSALENYLSNNKMDITAVTTEAPLAVKPFGAPFKIEDSIILVLNVHGAGGKTLSFKAKFYVLWEEKRELIIIGSVSLHALKLINLPSSIATASDAAGGSQIDLSHLDYKRIFNNKISSRKVTFMDTTPAPVQNVVSPVSTPGVSSCDVATLSDINIPSEFTDDQADTFNATISKGMEAGDFGPDLSEYDQKLEVRNMLDSALHEYLGRNIQFVHLYDLIWKYQELFRSTLNGDPPCLLEPFDVELINPQMKPFKLKARPYTRAKETFLEDWADMLIALQMAEVHYKAVYGSPTLAVPKPPNNWRFVLDYVKINQHIKQYQWPMPRLHEQFDKIAGCKYFAKVDLDNFYWQFGLTEAAQEILTIMTPKRMLKLKRMPQGVTNAVMWVQSRMTTLLQERKDRIHIWLDDILITGKTFEEFMDNWKFFLEKCKSVNLKLSPKKTTVFAEEVEWCGRLIGPKGIRFHPRKFQPLMDMNVPETGADLQQFICAANWFRTAIPNFAQLVHPLLEFLNKTCVPLAGNNKKSRLASVRLAQHGWNDSLTNVFLLVKTALANHMTLAHPDPACKMCVFTDASSTHWSAVVTQVREFNPTIPIQDQQHELLSMLSGTFNKTELLYPIVEKEAHAINQAVTKLGYLLQQPNGFLLFTDHANLTFMLDPLSSSCRVRGNSLDKIARWAFALFQLKFDIHHISGDDNVLADLLTRWGGAKIPEDQFEKNYFAAMSKDMPGISTLSGVTLDSDAKDLELKTNIFKYHVYAAEAGPALVRPTYTSFHNVSYSHIDDNFSWPSIAQIKAAQVAHSDDPFLVNPEFRDNIVRRNGIEGHDDVIFAFGKLWIPSAAKDLQIRFCIVAHCGGCFHRDHPTSYDYLEKTVYWNSMSRDFRYFYDTCLQCKAHSVQKEKLRPWGETIPASKPREVLEFDFLYIGTSSSCSFKYQYILVLKDKFSHFTWLFPCATCDTQSVVNALMQWFAIIGVSHTWISDQGSHFKNDVMNELNRQMGSNHHFVTSYAPWANGSVERLNQTILQMLRKGLAELAQSMDRWIDLVSTINKCINETKSASLGNRSPREVMFGFSDLDPISAVLYKGPDRFTTIAVNDVWGDLVTRSQNEIADMHSAIVLTQRQRRTLQNARRNKQHNVILANFYVGQYVI